MPSRERRALLALALALLARAAAGESRPGQDGGALVNQAMRQPMLAERIAKLYAQAGQDILAGRTPRALAEAVRDFDAGLRSLLASAGTPEIRDNYLLLGHLWEELRPIALRKPSLESAKKLAERTEEVAWIATKGARLVEARAAAPRGALIRTAGEVRVLSQRIAKLHLFRAWGVRSGPVASELKAADTEYQLAMAILRAAPTDTPDTASEIVLADNQYLFLGQAVARLQSGGDARRELEFVAKTCDNILEVMDRVARLYVARKD